ncbi:hypothetical protein LINPERPRIM_LOCUS20219, partial [Linum perenne]
GVLHIPKKVVDLGIQKLKSALVIQFLDSVPPLSPRVKPIDTSPKELPVWVTFKDVPPALVTHEGISWLATQIGTPINKFIRDGLDIKVCVVKNVEDEVPQSLTVVMDGGVQNSICVECREPIIYKRKGKGVYVLKAVPSKASVAGSDEGNSGSDPKPSHDGEGVPEVVHSEKDAGEGSNSSGNQPDAVEPSKQVSAEVIGTSAVALNSKATAALSPKSVSIDEGGTLVSDDDEVVYDESIVEPVQPQHPEVTKAPVRRVLGSEGVCKIGNPPFSEFLNSNKVLTPKGIINRPKTRRR